MKFEAFNLQSRLAASVVWVIVTGLAVLFLSLLVTPAYAVLAGENGRIVLVSGRPPETDATARLYLLPVPSNSVGGGLISAPITPPGGQYRHPTWSPDRTKIAYANGTANNFDLFVQDLAAGIGPVQITPTEGAGVNNLSADRPAWSPDGTMIAYEHQPSAGSADRHIRVQPANDLALPIPTTDLTTAGGPFEGKPAWTPDSEAVYFHRGDPNTATNTDIYRKPAAGGTETLAIPDSSISEAQPSISPDGTKICYTLTNGGFNSTADVVVAPIASPASGTIVSKSITLGDYNCTWSPDGQMVAYVNGIFGTGRLVMVRADNTSPLEIELAEAAGFDGNPDWAPDGRPVCTDTAVATTTGQPVTFTVECSDTGPEYELSDVREYADTQPAQGTLTQEFAGDPFTYAPNPGFTGTDQFEVNSFDQLGFGTERGTVTITVRAPDPPDPDPPDPDPDPDPVIRKCGGKNATIIGTTGRDVLNGTPGADVIAGLAGHDVIRGRGGRDIICGGSGKDRINGGRGKDRLTGNRGKDRLTGNRGNDVLRGGPGPDRLLGGPGRDRLFGGPGRDRLLGGPGRDLCNGNAGRDRASTCARRVTIP